eukprot:6274824-Lingulodinium_polyedra.AAC.1
MPRSQDPGRATKLVINRTLPTGTGERNTLIGSQHRKMRTNAGWDGGTVFGLGQRPGTSQR